MPEMRKVFSVLLVFSFSFLFAPGQATAQAGCVVSTLWKEVRGIEKWVCPPVVYASSETIDRENTIKAVTGCGIWGCPPYRWVVAGTGFSIQGSTTTKSDGQRVTIAADSTACGSGSITVTDACGATNSFMVRCTAGAWMYKGYQNAKWATSPVCPNCSHMGAIAEYIIAGNERWQLKPIVSGHACVSSPGCVEWGKGFNWPEPPCGDPQECAEGAWTCTCGAKLPYYSQYRYYTWECP